MLDTESVLVMVMSDDLFSHTLEIPRCKRSWNHVFVFGGTGLGLKQAGVYGDVSL